MKKLIVFLIPILMLAACSSEPEEAVKMDYKLDWTGDHLHVYLTYTPTDTNTVTLLYGNIGYGGQADIFSCVKNFHSDDCEIVPDSANRCITLNYEGTPVIHLDYEMEYDLEDENLNCPRELFRPNTDKDFLYVQGLNLFFRERSRAPYRQRVSWLNTPDFPTFCMYNEGGGFEPKVANGGDFQYAFILGDRGLNVDSFEMNGITNYMVTAPRQLPEYNRAAIKDFFTKYYTACQQFWNDTIDYSYTLVLYPFEKIRHEVTGLGLNHAFLSRYNHYADTILTDNRLNTIAHEVGHNWISGDQWFGEGFNDLQTWYLLTASGFYTPDEFVEKINDYIRSLHNSKIRNLPDDQISENFWKLGDYSWIIYWRGAVYGLRLMAQMEAATGDVHSFKTLMNALGKEHTTHMNKDYFIEVTSQFIDRDLLESEFERFITNAETMTTDIPMPAGCALKFDKTGTPYVVITDHNAFAAHFVL